MKVHDLKPAPGSTRARRRVGRGIGGKGGKTAGRGTKGQSARGQIPAGFEGGQLPLAQRIPKLKGFKNPFRVEYNAVNLDALEKIPGNNVNPDTLRCSLLMVTDALLELSERLDEAAARLRAGELEPEATLALIEECAQLATEASAQVDERVRAALEPLPDLPGQLPLPTP